MTLYSAMMAAGIQLTFREEPLIYAKAIKNRAELQGFEQAHIKDGIAMALQPLAQDMRRAGR